MTTMAERLKQARELAGFNTATEAARSLRIAQQTYLAHENGSRGFIKQAGRYAAFYRVDIRWLLTGVGSPRGRAVETELALLSPEKQAQVFEYIEFLKRTGTK